MGKPKVTKGWPLAERAAAFEPKNRIVPPSESYLKHLSAEQRMAALQAELKARRG